MTVGWTNWLTAKLGNRRAEVVPAPELADPAFHFPRGAESVRTANFKMSLPSRTPRGTQKRQQLRQRNGVMPVQRTPSGGLLGTLKSALSWFNPSVSAEADRAGDDSDAAMVDDESGVVGDKRRIRSPGRGDQPAAKRARHASPPRASVTTHPFGEPPASLFLSPSRRQPSPAKGAVGTLSLSKTASMPRAQSLALPVASSSLASFGQAPSSSLQQASLERHSSLGPPGFSSRDSVQARSSLFLTRTQSSTFSDRATGSPQRSPVRSSFTPQPTGATFGPLPPRRSRDPSAPPLLAGTVDSRRSPFKTAVLNRTASSTNLVAPSVSSTVRTFVGLCSSSPS
jgi:hypothetical protein